MASQRPILRRGDGIKTPHLRDEVKQVQTYLKNSEFLNKNSPIDGLFGIQTETAVKRFQNLNRLTVDGVVGNKTWTALIAYSVAPKPSNSGNNNQFNNNQINLNNQPSIFNSKPLLQRGDGLSNPNLKDAVKQLQSLLKKVQALPANSLIDGVFDQQTEAAVIGFQRRNNLTVNGIVNQQTWAALERQTQTNPGNSSTRPNSPSTETPISLSNQPKPTLRKGDGINLPHLQDEVKMLQNVLKTIGFLSNNAPIDGLFGEETEAAVRKFQLQQKLLVNGIVDRVTWWALETYLSKQNSNSSSLEDSLFSDLTVNNQINKPVDQNNNNSKYPILQKGDGLDVPELKDEVKTLQQLLTDQGFLNDSVDGLFGPITEAAVKQLQRSRKLAVDGIVGAATWAALLNQSVTVYNPNRAIVNSPKIQAIVNSIPNATIRKYAAKSIPIILQECQSSNVTDKGQIAYILATAEHESRLGQWMVEFASGQAYEGRRDLGNTQRGDGVRYKGRGFVQITGRRNYTNWSERLKIDLVGNPEKATQQDIAAKILVQGMRDGTFTGRKLGEFIAGNNRDFYNARRIVNGLDRASHIANIARRFLRVI